MVIHYGPPMHKDDFVQEMGRADIIYSQRRQFLFTIVVTYESVIKLSKRMPRVKTHTFAKYF